MASVRKFPGSKYWYAAYSLPDGRRVQRSTKLTDRKKAQKMADKLEEAAQGRLQAKQAHRLIAEVYEAANGSNLLDSTVKGYFTSWLQRRKGETAHATHTFYEGKATAFLNFLGKRAECPILDITTADILAYRDAQAARLSPSSVNHSIKFLRMVFEDAKRDNLLADNPAASVRTLKKATGTPRRPFTLEELKAVLSVANDEWRSLILFGLYTGQRLIDLARLSWSGVDTINKEVRIVPSKTGRTVIIPMAKPLLQHIESLPVSDDPEQPLHPRAFEILQKQKKSGTLSNQFYDLLVKAGLAQRKKHRKREGGDADRRQVFPITFHSLRHTATSLMKNAGVSPAVVQDIIGHESSAISANYTHIESDAKRKALESMPDVTD